MPCVVESNYALNERCQAHRNTGITGGCVEILPSVRAIIIDLNMESILCVAHSALKANHQVQLAGRGNLEAVALHIVDHVLLAAGQGSVGGSQLPLRQMTIGVD